MGYVLCFVVVSSFVVDDCFVMVVVFLLWNPLSWDLVVGYLLCNCVECVLWNLCCGIFCCGIFGAEHLL